MKKTCPCFLSVKKETCFYWGKDNIQLALSFSKFLHFCLVGVREAETVFASRLRLWDKNSSVPAQQGREIYFLSSFLVPVLIDTPLTPQGGGISGPLPAVW